MNHDAYVATLQPTFYAPLDYIGPGGELYDLDNNAIGIAPPGIEHQTPTAVLWQAGSIRTMSTPLTLDFDGMDDNDFTLSLWVSIDDVGSRVPLFTLESANNAIALVARITFDGLFIDALVQEDAYEERITLRGVEFSEWSNIVLLRRGEHYIWMLNNTQYDIYDRAPIAADDWDMSHEFEFDVQSLAFFNTALDRYTLDTMYFLATAVDTDRAEPTDYADSTLDGEQARRLDVVRYTFDTDIVHDASGWGNHGVNSGVEQSRPLVSGRGQSASFSNSYTTIPDSLSLHASDNSFTVEFWANIGYDGTIIHKQDSWAIWIENGQLHASLQDSQGHVDSGPLGAFITPGSTSYIAVLFDRSIGEIRAVVNGDASPTGVRLRNEHTTNAGGSIEIGRGPYGYINGHLDNLIVSMNLLSEPELAFEHALGSKYYNYTTTVGYSNPTLLTEFYTFDDLGFIDVDDAALDGNEPVYDPHTLIPAPSPVWGKRFGVRGEFSYTDVDIQSVEVVASGTGRVLTIVHEDDSMTTVDITDMTVTVGRGDTTVASIIPNWAHIGIRFASDVEVVVNGVPIESLSWSPSAISSLRAGSDNAVIGALAGYATFVSDIEFRQHFDTAYSGRFMVTSGHDDTPLMLEEIGFDVLDLDWTVAPA